jgi:hypothetical protein
VPLALPALQGDFVRGLPAGTGTFTLTGHRTLDMPCFAATHIQVCMGVCTHVFAGTSA